MESRPEPVARVPARVTGHGDALWWGALGARRDGQDRDHEGHGPDVRALLHHHQLLGPDEHPRHGPPVQGHCPERLLVRLR